MAVCSYKIVVKFFPHQAADLELAVGLLEQCEEEVGCLLYHLRTSSTLSTRCRSMHLPDVQDRVYSKWSQAGAAMTVLQIDICTSRVLGFAILHVIVVTSSCPYVICRCVFSY